jgi:hypothetical protein
VPLGHNTGVIVNAFSAVQSSGLKARETRRQLFMRARMRAGGAPVDVCIRNISSRGMLLQASAPPPRGTYVEIICPFHTIVARVIWAQDRRFGVQTRLPMDVSAVVGDTAAPRAPKSPSPAITLASWAEQRPISDIQRRLDRSRRLSSVMEFAFFLVLSAAAAAFTANIVYEFLAGTFQSITRHL